MTIKEYQKKLDKRIDEVKMSNKRLYNCINDAHSDYVKRIFEDGLNSRLASIGSYSTKPMLAGKKAFEGLNVGAFKENDAKWLTLNTKKGKRKVKLMEISGGYKQYRGLVNRQNSKVDLKLRGRLFTDVANSLTRKGSTFVNGVKNKENLGKVDGAIKRFGKDTFMSDSKMRKKLADCLGKQLVKIMTK